jgi:hypothetical protein
MTSEEQKAAGTKAGEKAIKETTTGELRKAVERCRALPDNAYACGFVEAVELDAAFSGIHRAPRTR